MKRLLIAFSGVLAGAFFAQATDVSGPVSGVWTPAGNPYNLVDSIWVHYGQTLTILPGVDVDWVTNGTSFSAYGRLEALGAAQNPIDMTSGTGTYLLLNLSGIGTEADSLAFVALNGKITLSGGGHALKHVQLYYQATGGEAANQSPKGIKGPADNVVIDNCNLQIIASNGFPWVATAAYGIFEVDGWIGHCNLDIQAHNSISGEIASYATAVGIQDCQGTVYANSIFVNSHNGYGDMMSSSATGLMDCVGPKQFNFIKVQAEGNNKVAKGIFGGSGDVINNTILIPTPFTGSTGIANASQVRNNVILNMNGSGTGISGGASLGYNTLWGFINYYMSPPVDTIANRIEDPQIGSSTGLLLNQSPCINHGDPDSAFNDPDGSRNDRGFLPFDPGTGANLVASQNALYFGPIPVTQDSDMTIVFTNVGQSPGQINSYFTSNPSYSAISGVPSLPIQPGASVLITIRFAPQNFIPYEYHEIRFIGTIPPYSIELHGEGVLQGGYTPVSGNIDRPTTWYLAGSPYHLIGSVNVLSSGTLTIEPGVEIFAMGPYHIYAAGGFTAIGNVNDSIFFKPFSPAIHWKGIDIENDLGTKSLSYCVIEGCIGDSLMDLNGGAICVLNEELSLAHSHLSANSAQAGSGIYADGATLHLESNLFNQNASQGTDSLTLICALNSSVWLSGNSILSNDAPDGAIFISGGAVEIFDHNLIANNSGAGSHFAGATLPIFDLNTVADNARGLLISLAAGQIFTGRNMILWGNGSGSSGDQLEVTGGTAALSYTDLQGGWAGVGNLNINPLFVDPLAGDYHLQSLTGSYHIGQWLPDPQHSPCIDAGDPTSPFLLEPSPNGLRVNIGAYGNSPEASLSLSGYALFGPISGTLPAAYNPYLVVDSVWVPQDSFLIIEPGVQITFQGHFKFSVLQGATLRAIGTPQDSIIFSPSDTGVGWHGIRFYNASDSCQLEYCRLTHGIASGQPSPNALGGAIFGYNTDAIIRHCLIEHCRAELGGAIDSYYGSMLISDNVIRENTATDKGGALLFSFGEPIINNNAICDNTAADDGGAIHLWTQANAVISHNYISGNTATGQSGGAVFSLESNPAILDNFFADNIATESGGAIIALASSATTITGNVFASNWANVSGGAIYCGSANPLIEDNLFYRNHATSEAGGVMVSGDAVLNKNTFFGNTAGVHAGGLVSYWGTTSAVTNCIFWEDTPREIHVANGILNVSYSDLTNGWPGIGNISADPLFVSVPQGDYLLSQIAAGQSQQSPCVDAGNPATPMVVGTTRTDGVQDAGVIDMGYHYPLFTATSPVSITLMPYGTPIVIPANGGSFSYNIAVANSGSSPATADVWCDITLPNGHIAGPTLGPVNLTLPAGFSLNRDRTQNIPRSAPPGNYTYNGYVGLYPNTIYDQDSFPFSKSITGDGPGVDNWTNTGESFADWMTPIAAAVPESYTLGQNHPNPFNPLTTINYGLPEEGWVKLAVYDLLGREVAVLVNAYRPAGSHEATFDASGLASGIYVYRLTAGDFSAVKKLMLLK